MSVLASEWRERRARAAPGRGSRAGRPTAGAGRRRSCRARPVGRQLAGGADSMASTGPAPTRPARRSGTLMEAKGHVVDNARAAVAGLEAAFADGRAATDAGAGRDARRPDGRARAGRGPEARRQVRRGRPVHPARHLARARQRLTEGLTLDQPEGSGWRRWSATAPKPTAGRPDPDRAIRAPDRAVDRRAPALRRAGPAPARGRRSVHRLPPLSTGPARDRSGDRAAARPRGADRGDPRGPRRG